MKIPGIPLKRFEKIFSLKTNIICATDSYTVKAIKCPNSEINRMGLVTGKKAISKLAVDRNRADRRLKSALQTVYPKLKVKGYDFVFFLKPSVITTPWPQLTKDVWFSINKLERKIATPAKKFKK